MELRINRGQPDARAGKVPRRSSRAATDEALARIVADHSDAVYRLARSVVRDSALAADVVQETMVKAWRALPEWPDEEIPRAWLMKVARNTAISMLRTRRDDPVELDDLVGVASGMAATADAATDKVAMDHLWAALADLDETTRSLVVMRELSGLSYEEIAEVLDLPLSTVKTRLFRARKTLQAKMRDWR